MTVVDPWAPVDRDWKEFAEPALGQESRSFDHAILETDCPKCGRHVGALIIDGPDPVFVDVQCPHVECGEVWNERFADEHPEQNS